MTVDRILAVVAPTDADVELLEEAGTVAAATGVDVVVLALALDGDDYTSVEAMRRWEEFEETGHDEPVETAHRFADHLGRRVLDPLPVEYLPVGGQVESSRPSDKVIAVAESHGCDHVFITNRSHSPAGKALFGDTTQSVILNFDGYVTVRTA